MEQVLIWPKEYPLLVKGLVEQNGAFILDALEAWPSCGTSEDDQGVVSTVLPPLYYLQWMKPLEPFEACYYQHIAEFDETAQRYLIQLSQHFEAAEMAQESQILTLLGPFSGYSDIAAQATVDTSISLFKLLYDKRYFNVIAFCLEQGATLSADDVMLLWQELEFREKLTKHIPQQVRNVDTLETAVCDAISQGEDFYTLLELINENDVKDKLEEALLAHLSLENAKQSMAIRFIEQGAKGLAVNSLGESAIHLAAQKGFMDVVEQLQSESIEQADLKGNKPIHHAVVGNALPVVKRLIQLGADAKSKNLDGLSVYGLAVTLRRSAIIKSLESDFNLKELTPEEEFQKIRLAHVLSMLTSAMLPGVLFFFFDDGFAYKSEVTFGFTAFAIIFLMLGIKLKRDESYPIKGHPWSLVLLGVLSWLSVIGLLGLSVIAALTLLR